MWNIQYVFLVENILKNDHFFRLDVTHVQLHNCNRKWYILRSQQKMTGLSFPNSCPCCRHPRCCCHSHQIHYRPACRSWPSLKVAHYLLCSQPDPSKKLCTYRPLQQLCCKVCKTDLVTRDVTTCDPKRWLTLTFLRLTMTQSSDSPWLVIYMTHRYDSWTLDSLWFDMTRLPCIYMIVSQEDSLKLVFLVNTGRLEARPR